MELPTLQGIIHGPDSESLAFTAFVGASGEQLAANAASYELGVHLTEADDVSLAFMYRDDLFKEVCRERGECPARR